MTSGHLEIYTTLTDVTGRNLIRDTMPCLGGMGAVRLLKGLTDCGGHDRMLAFGDMSQRVWHPVYAAPLPGRRKHAGNGGLEAGVSITDNQLHPVEPAIALGPQKVYPERLCLRRADAQPDDFPAAFGIGRHGDYGRHADNPATLTLLEIGGSSQT